MKIEEQFFKGKKEDINNINNMFNMLYDRISVYDTGDYPVLAGEKLKYSEFIKEEEKELCNKCYIMRD